MKNFPHTVSEDMYHRVYRLMKRDIDSRLIAAALNLPLRTVLNVIARLKKNEQLDTSGAAPPVVNQLSGEAFLDVYILTKTRYAVVQLVGHLVGEKKTLLEQEIRKVESSTWKAVAICMTDVVELDSACARILLEFNTAMKSHDRYVAILDPPTCIEDQLIEFQIDGNVPIFGTERAFEAEAFPHKPAAAPHSRA